MVNGIRDHRQIRLTRNGKLGLYWGQLWQLFVSDESSLINSFWMMVLRLDCIKLKSKA